jgi:hypothetical protein
LFILGELYKSERTATRLPSQGQRELGKCEKNTCMRGLQIDEPEGSYGEVRGAVVAPALCRCLNIPTLLKKRGVGDGMGDAKKGGGGMPWPKSS